MTVYNVELKCISPVHVGNGEILRKNSYVFDKQKKLVYIVDNKKFMRWIIEHGLQDSYEKYFMYNTKGEKPLYNWLRDNKALGEVKNFTNYSLKTDSLRFEYKKGLNDIAVFTKEGNTPYIPGSTLKGFLRTCIIANLYRGKKRYEFDQYMKSGSSKKNINNRIKPLEGRISKLEKDTFELKLTEKDKMNQMRKLIVSDSESLSRDDLILAQKIDESISGKVNNLPLCRESLKPGTLVKFQIKLEEFEIDGTKIDIEYIKDSIEQFYIDNDENFLKKFGISERDGLYLYLGGGSGFVSKTVVYPFMEDYNGNKSAVSLVGKILNDKFARGKVDHLSLAKKNDISPQALKLTEYNGNEYEMGLCEIKFEEVKK